MDFTYSEEQRMLADSLRRFIQTDYTFERRRKAARSGASFERRVWAQLAELGVLGLTVPTEFGGFGEGSASQLAVQRELGRGLVLEPVVPCAAIATAVLIHGGNTAQKHEWLPVIATGQRVVGIAYLEPASRYRPEAVQCVAAREGEAFVLNGSKCLVWHGHVADAYLVSARLDGTLALFLVPRDARGLTVAPYATMDGLQGADLHCDNVRIAQDATGDLENGAAALEQGLDYGIAAQCAAAAGAMERLIEITREYLATRTQFGKPLAAFQALQHRLADMLVQKECALSMAYVAARALDERDPGARRRMLSGAKVLVARAARFVGQQAVQLHGGMGMTDELEIGDYFKYLTMVDVLLGDMDYHMERYCEAMAS